MRGAARRSALLACAAALALVACTRHLTAPAAERVTSGRGTPVKPAAAGPAAVKAGPAEPAAVKPAPAGSAALKPSPAGPPPVNAAPGGRRAEAATGHGGDVTYTNSHYGFTLRLPATMKAVPFDGPWSVEALTGYGGRSGSPVVAVTVFSVNHGGVATGQPYPLFFSAEVRVGVSTDIAQCYQAPVSVRRGSAVHDEVIGGIAFKAVPISDAGMMKYLKAVSYRVIHARRCYAVEQIARGSSYRDSSMKPGLTQEQLDAYYREASAIAHTFRFLAPGAPIAPQADGQGSP